jgi:hypothetical protein
MLDIWNLQTGGIEKKITIPANEFVLEFYYKNRQLIVVSSNQENSKLTLRGFIIDGKVFII